MKNALLFQALDLLEEGIIVFDGGVISYANSIARKWFEKIEENLTRASLIDASGAGSAALQDLKPGNRVVIVLGGRLVEVREDDLEGSHVWLARDCSEELRLQSQIAEQGHLLASNTEAYIVVDRHGIIRYANPVAERERGLESGQFAGTYLGEWERRRESQSDSSYVLADDDEVMDRVTSFLKEGVVQRYNAWHLRQDGSHFPVEVTARPYRLQSDTVLLLNVRDETERLNNIQRLMEARAQAEASNRAKSAFMAVTSHELRTPLTTIIGFCELIMLDVIDEDQSDLAKYLRLILKSSKSLQALINDILEFAKIESQTVNLEIESLSAESLVEEAVTRWELRIKEAGLEMRRAPTQGESGHFVGDPIRINQLLDNLINNARKFTEEGSVELQLIQDEESVSFWVRDTGLGIPIGMEERIFDPFTQVDDQTTRTTDGTGLGLYICKNLTRLLGGEIVLEETSENGSAFRITLPRNGPQDSA